MEEIVTSVARDKELIQALTRLQDLIDSKEVMTAERKAAKLLMDRGYERLLATLIGNSDYLINSFTFAYRYKRRSMAGIRVGFKRPGGNVAHLVDLGTEERYTKTGAYRGKIKGSHFWTDTKEQYVPKARDLILDAVENAIKKINNGKITGGLLN